jgi:hypothetical protein
MSKKLEGIRSRSSPEATAAQGWRPLGALPPRGPPNLDKRVAATPAITDCALIKSTTRKHCDRSS